MLYIFQQQTICKLPFPQKSKKSILTYLKNRVATNQKRVIEAQKPKEQKHNAKENQTIEGKRRRKRSKKKQKSTGKEGLKW